MAFPLVALLTAAAQDMQSRSDEESARLKMQDNAVQDVYKTRAQQLRAQPYGMMAQDYENSLSEFQRNADAQRNNQIGALLQSYLKDSGGGQGQLIGGDESGDRWMRSEPSGYGDVMGKSQIDPWDKDPWGDAGF